MLSQQLKVISLGVAAPQYLYRQRDIFDELGYPSHFWRIFRDSQIENRHLCIPPWDARKLTFQEQQDEYKRSAVQLSKEAIIDCLDGRDPKSIGCLVFSSCTGIVPGPTVGHYLIPEIGFSPDIRIRNVANQGCEGGGFPGLGTAVDFLVAHQRQAIVVACELSSLTYYPEPDGKPDPENDYELMRANSIFGDYVSVALVGFDDDPKHPFVVDSQCFTNTDYLDDLGYIWRDGRLRVRLSRRVPQLAGEVSHKAVRPVLLRNGLRATDIEHWIVHAAGMKVLDIIRDNLGIDEEKFRFSRYFLRNNGNCSSATVGGIAKLFIDEVTPSPGDLLMVVTVGPGMTGGVSLLRFP